MLVDATDWLAAVFVDYVPRLEPYVWPAASCAQTATVWTVLLLTVWNSGPFFGISGAVHKSTGTVHAIVYRLTKQLTALCDSLFAILSLLGDPWVVTIRHVNVNYTAN